MYKEKKPIWAKDTVINLVQVDVNCAARRLFV